MRAKTKDMKKRIQQLLVNHEYINMVAIQQSIKLSKGSVYRMIRMIKEDGVGVYSTPNGYTLAEYASHRDDTRFMRQINGRRLSDFVSAKAAAKHIRKRWHGLRDEAEIKGLLDDFTGSGELLAKRQQLLTDKLEQHKRSLLQMSQVR